jgi:carbamoyltransferase
MNKKIMAVALNLHDHNTYDGVWHNQRERQTRFKHNLPYRAEAYAHQSDILNPGDYRLNDEFTKEYFKKPDDGVLAFTYTYGGVRMSKDELLETVLKGHDEIFDWQPKKLWDHYYKDDIYFIDHHQSHAAYAFINSGFEEADCLAIDGIGNRYRCCFFDKHGTMTDLSNILPIGWLWNHMSNLTGFGTLGAGKLMGLSAYGRNNDYFYEIFETILAGPITEKKQEKFEEYIDLNRYRKEDLAFTLQKFTMDKIREFVHPLQSSHNLCVAGGVSYNGYMNEAFTKRWKNVHVPPAVGDEGQALGAYQHADYVLNGNKHVVDTYSGKAYDWEPTEDERINDQNMYERWSSGKGFQWGYEALFWEPLNMTEVAQQIADGKTVGWFQGKSESGNRALGNRSILADPRNPDIKEIINSSIKMREDFRPFAPAVMEEHYKEYFATNQPSPYMSRIMPVISDKIPGVTHVDGTARIQTVNREQNEKYYDIINEFYKITGIPMLLNTSFNSQEPIVEEPWHAIRTFRETAIDILVIGDWMLIKKVTSDGWG